MDSKVQEKIDRAKKIRRLMNSYIGDVYNIIKSSNWKIEGYPNKDRVLLTTDNPSIGDLLDGLLGDMYQGEEVDNGSRGYIITSNVNGFVSDIEYLEKYLG